MDLQEASLRVPPELHSVCEEDDCHEPIERLYYSANSDDICVYCAGEVSPWSSTEKYYPQCEDCADRPHIANVRKS